MKLPIQPTYVDNDKVIRFRGNKIVRYLLDNGSLDLNKLARAVSDCNEDWEQFAQLIGYSLSGFADLSYVSDETFATADAMARGGLSERDARIQYLETLLTEVRQDVKALAPRLFRIHPEDLHE